MEQKWVCILLPLLLLYDSKWIQCTLYSIIIHWYMIHYYYFRSMFSIDIVMEFLVAGNDGCHIPIDIPLHSIDVLALYLSWSTTNWTEFLYLLSTKNSGRLSHLVVCDSLGHLGEMEWITWCHIQSFYRHKKLWSKLHFTLHSIFSYLRFHIKLLIISLLSVSVFLCRILKYFYWLLVYCIWCICYSW